MFWKRRFPRLRKDFQITYRMVDQETFENDPISAMAVNLSGGGVCFEASEHLQKGSLVALDIRSDDFGSPILALAKVVWCKSQRGEYTVGAEFWWIGWGDKTAQNTIANYVMAQTAAPSMALLG